MVWGDSDVTTIMMLVAYCQRYHVFVSEGDRCSASMDGNGHVDIRIQDGER